MDDRPIEASYWVIPRRLLAGEYPGAAWEAEARAKLERFLAAGVSTFVDLTEVDDGLEPYAVLLADEAAACGRVARHERHPIPDLGVPTPARMRAILDAIDAALAAGEVVYVHCWGGVGRTGTVVGCYLVRHGASGDEALGRVAELFATTSRFGLRSPESAAQIEFVRSYAEP